MTEVAILACDNSLFEQLPALMKQNIILRAVVPTYIHITADEKTPKRVVPSLVIMFDAAWSPPVTGKEQEIPEDKYPGSTEPYDDSLPYVDNQIETDAFKAFKEQEAKKKQEAMQNGKSVSP